MGRQRWKILAVVLANALACTGGTALLHAAPPAEGANVSEGTRTQPALDELGDPLPAGALARLGTARLRHVNRVFAVAFSPDGRTIASGGHDRVVRLWETASGKELLQLRGHQDVVDAVAFSPDGKLLATGSADKTIRLWDPITGKHLHTLQGHQGSIESVAFSSTGTVLASASFDHTVRLWDVDMTRESPGRLGKELPRPEPADKEVMSVAFVPGGKTLVYAAGDPLVRLCDTVTGKELRRFTWQATSDSPFHECHLALSPDGKILAAGGYEQRRVNHWTGTIHLWETATGKPLRSIEGLKDSVWLVAFAPDGRTLLAALGDDPTTRLWDVSTGKEQGHWAGHEGGTFAVAFAPDGKTAATGGGDHRVRLWDTSTKKELHPFAGHEGGIIGLGFLDGKTLATADWNGVVRLWDRAANKAAWNMRTVSRKEYGPARQIVFSMGGRVGAAVEDHGLIRVWEPVTGNSLFERRLGGGEAACVAFSPDGRRLAAGGAGGACVWDTDLTRAIPGRLGKELLQRPRQHVLAIGFSQGGKVLALGSFGEVILLEVSTGKELLRLPYGSENERPLEVTSVTFSPDGKTLATISSDSQLLLWDIRQDKQPVKRPVASGIACAAFSRDSRIVAAGDWHGAVHLWEVATGEGIIRFKGHEDSVKSLQFAPDGRSVLSGGVDTTVLVWDVTGRALGGGGRADDLNAEQLAVHWTALAGATTPEAYRAVWALVGSPGQSLPLLQRHLLPVEPVAAEHMARLVKDLDSPQFTVREQATAELEKVAEVTAPALRRLLQDQVGPEVRKRLESVLDKLEGRPLSSEDRRMLRAVMVLEQIDTAEARNVLQALGNGAAAARRTQEARAALERLGRREAP
jgi:WD40 repeat protein